MDGDCTQAVVVYKNGDSYDGQMRENKYHGKGKLTTKKLTQLGLFRESRFVHGKVIFEDGSVYEGSL